MALKTTAARVGFAAIGAIALIWSGSTEGISARTRVFGDDRMSFQPLPNADGEMCVLPPYSARMAAAVPEPQPSAEWEWARTQFTGTSRIGSLPPAASTVGEICEVPSFAAGAGAAGAQAQRRPLPPLVGERAAESVPRTITARSAVINRPPVRYLKDPYAAFSSIAVNVENDMVIMTDENLFRILEYSRRDNTPPGAPLTEPRRAIGGDQTRTEMMCGSYIDPKTLEVWVTNNDTQNWLPVFSREARGNAAPDRVLATPHRTWGITGDEIRQEIYLTIQGAGAVVVYRKDASNYDAPVRVLRGDATELADPHGIALDIKRDLMVIANHGHRQRSVPSPARTPMPWEEYQKVWSRSMEEETGLRSIPSLFPAAPGEGRGGGGGEGDDAGGGGGWFDFPSITIHARGASGNTAPLRVIKGARTRLNWPSHVSLHEGRGEIFVANDADDSVLVFNITDSGDVAPKRVIKGARTRIKNPTGVYVDAVNNEVWVASMGNYTAAVFPVTASGDVAPIRQIRGGPENGEALMIGNPGAVGYDSKRQEVLVPN
jgi:DNA-binding beta-propeller fold protein YncE